MKFRDGYEGQLVETIHLQLPYELHPVQEVDTEFLKLDCLGELTILAGYCWDYASVPLTGWISNKIAGKKTKYPSLVHDALCQLGRNGYLPHDPTREHTDRFFYDLLLQRKLWRIRAWCWYKAVRIGARFAKQKPKEVYEVE